MRGRAADRYGRNSPAHARKTHAAHRLAEGSGKYNGVFYRSMTIDREQLRGSWFGIGSLEAKEQLAQMVEAPLRTT